MQKAAIIASFILAGALASCSEIPKRGFATRYLASTLGPTIHDAIVPSTDFAGNPIADNWRSEFSEPPIAAPTSRRVVNGIAVSDCAEVARSRAHDVSDEGFDADVQSQVYEHALADCRAWQKLER